MTLALPPSMIATHELVVPRSMPMIFAIVWFPLGIAWIACLDGRPGRPMNAIWGSRAGGSSAARRSEEHTSELQSLMRNSYAVFCLKKKKNSELKQYHKNILH